MSTRESAVVLTDAKDQHLPHRRTPLGPLPEKARKQCACVHSTGVRLDLSLNRADPGPTWSVRVTYSDGGDNDLQIPAQERVFTSERSRIGHSPAAAEIRHARTPPVFGTPEIRTSDLLVRSLSQGLRLSTPDDDWLCLQSLKL